MAKLLWKPCGKVFGFDTETTGLNPYGSKERWGFYPARPFAFSFCDEDGSTFYIRWQVDPMTREVKINREEFEWMRKLFSDSSLTVVGHNISFDIKMLLLMEIEVKCKIRDTLALAHVFTGGSEFTYALKPLCVRYFQFADDDEKDLKESTQKARRQGKKLGWCVATEEYHGKEPYRADYWMADQELCKKYAVKDAERTMLIYLTWLPEVEKVPNLKLIYDKETKLLPVVLKMEHAGTRVFKEDVIRLKKFYRDYQLKQVAIADANGGKGMNFRSSKQKVERLFNQKGLEPLKKTKSGQPKTDGETLQLLAQKDPLARAILEYNGAAHALSAFLHPYERFMVEEAPGVWVLHPNFRQCGPITGRFSCGDPNLMQVASETTGRRKTEITLRPREAFGPREGYVWYLPDYSQVEVWAFSFLAQDENMMKALLAGHDFHGAIAESIWGKEKDYADKKSYYRKRAKLLMFCKLYGGGASKIAFLLECSKEEAEKFVRDYDKALPGVQTFMKRMINRARKDGMVENAFGRRYLIDTDFAYRAVNYLVQGTCADIMKQAMINVDELFEEWTGSRLLLTLHDELVLEIPKKYHSKKLMKEILVAMQGDFHKTLGIPRPLPIGMKIATKRWSVTTEIDL